jgi:autophagy-related protein 33
MAPSAVPLFKFVGTVSLGLLTGVSYTVSTLALPNLLNLSSSAAASHALTTLTASLKLPILALSSLASAPLLLSFALSPRSSRHPYLVYTSLLTVLSLVVPNFVARTTPRPIAPAPAKKQASTRARMEASYEVLGDVQSEAASDEEIDEYNGEEVRTEVEAVGRGYVVRTGLAALGFAMAVVGIWGDGAPQAVVYVA